MRMAADRKPGQALDPVGIAVGPIFRGAGVPCRQRLDCVWVPTAWEGLP